MASSRAFRSKDLKASYLEPSVARRVPVCGPDACEGEEGSGRELLGARDAALALSFVGNSWFSAVLWVFLQGFRPL